MATNSMKQLHQWYDYPGNHYKGHDILCSNCVEAEFEIILMHKFIQSIASFQSFVYFQVGPSAVSKLMILKKTTNQNTTKPQATIQTAVSQYFLIYY